VKYVRLRRWHIARAYGHRKGVPEVDTLCGRRTNREWTVRDDWLQLLLDGMLCQTCFGMAVRRSWL
jgi:hypothetical protein